MKVAIENFVQLDKENKVAILGDMFELGDESAAEHKIIVEMLLNIENIECFFIGKYFYQHIIDTKHFHFFETFDSLANEIRKNPFSCKTILIKGSRGMALERTLELM